MKNLLVILIVFTTLGTKAQDQKKLYATYGGEMIFSFASIDNNGKTGGNIMRWTPEINIQVFGNYDINKNLGLIFGGAIRNVGFIYQYPGTDSLGNTVKKKFRNYCLGIPVGFKVGNMDKFFFFGGYEIEFPFHYKEKTFLNDAKQDAKITTWFTSRTPAVYNTLFAGVQFPFGISLKFKYYLNEFLNENYTETGGVKPYQGLKANVWYLSLSVALFKGKYLFFKEELDKK